MNETIELILQALIRHTEDQDLREDLYAILKNKHAKDAYYAERWAELDAKRKTA